MRNHKRIPYVLRELEALWSNYPDWRLGQLVFNIAGRDPFYIEDYDLIEVGFEKFTDKTPSMGDFPEYWCDPHGFKEALKDLRKID